MSKKTVNFKFGFASFFLSPRLAAKIILLICGLSYYAAAQEKDSSLLTLERIFSSREFIPQRLGGFRWLKDGNTYAKLEPSPTIKESMDLVSYNIENQHREVLIAAEKLIPAGSRTPLSIEGYDWSADDRRVLIYTNSKKVWRLNTKGDYWLLETATGRLTKIGGDAEASTLMFAKFSPDGTKIGYVRENDLYVQNVADNKITRLTADGSHTLINGTSDWVNEEEFELRDCWRWSPDGGSIAFWQFNAEGIRDFILLNNTTGIYPSLTRIPYPKTGTTNSAVRIGVVNAGGGAVKWIRTPGDLRSNYIVSVDWTDDSSAVVMQHLNRLQNNLQLLSADVKTGAVKTILTETDAAWIDVALPKMRRLENGKRFLWISERDGWKHAYTVSADGQDTKLLTPGNFDVISVQAVDEIGGWLYYIASPDNAAQRYLFRTRLDGKGAAEKVTPEAFKGWNTYNISPNNHWAVQTSSTFSSAAKYNLLNLASKSVTRTMLENKELQAGLDKIKKGPQEFFRVDIGGGTSLDGWMVKPPDFDPAKKYPVLFYVYGEPAGQTVMDIYGGGDYLWNLMLAQQGYIVASVDNRGTPVAARPGLAKKHLPAARRAQFS